jgi:hypothetical protein
MFDSSVDTQAKKEKLIGKHFKFFGPEVNLVSEAEENDHEVSRFYVVHGVDIASKYIADRLKKDKGVRRVKIIS